MRDYREEYGEDYGLAEPNDYKNYFKGRIE